MGKLTDRQRAVLARLAKASGRASTYWLSGGNAMTTDQARRACRQLESKGLVICDQGGYSPYFYITPAGLAALQGDGHE